MNIYLLRLVECLFVILSFNAKALVVNDCTWSGNQCYRAIFNNHDLSGLNLSVHYDDSTLTYSIFENSSGQNARARYEEGNKIAKVLDELR